MCINAKKNKKKEKRTVASDWGKLGTTSKVVNNGSKVSGQGASNWYMDVEQKPHEIEWEAIGKMFVRGVILHFTGGYTQIVQGITYVVGSGTGDVIIEVFAEGGAQELINKRYGGDVNQFLIDRGKVAVIDGVTFGISKFISFKLQGSGKLTPEQASDKVTNGNRVGSALKDDPYHQGASYLSKEQLSKGQTFSITGGDGVQRTLLQVEGGLNGSTGIFEYIIDSNGNITHQLFIKDGIITGFPNQ